MSKPIIFIYQNSSTHLIVTFSLSKKSKHKIK